MRERERDRQKERENKTEGNRDITKERKGR